MVDCLQCLALVVDSGSIWERLYFSTEGTMTISAASEPLRWHFAADLQDVRLVEYDDGKCNRGCGLRDPDCATSSADSCPLCDPNQSCAVNNSCLGVSATDNAVCN